MEIFYDPDSKLSLLDFGIEVPLTDYRTDQVVNYLNKNDIIIKKVGDSKAYRPITKKDIRRAHNHTFSERLFESEESKAAAIAISFELINRDGSFHRYDPSVATKPLDLLVDQFFSQSSATLIAARAASQNRASFFLGGGFHHAMSFGGRGFCLINDIVIAARVLQEEEGLKNVWVIDIDVHKGDGTAEITKSDSSIVTFSIHMAEGWPLENPEEKDEPWWISSDVDIAVSPKDNHRYLELLNNGLNQLNEFEKPDLAIVVQGSDPYEYDSLPSSSDIKLSLSEMLQRDLMVYDFLEKAQIPHCHLMAGGYGLKAHEPFIEFFKHI